jgi:hypothetical protein
MTSRRSHRLTQEFYVRPLLSAALVISALVLCSPSRAEDVSSWLHRLGHWKMIGSETLSVQEDPPAVALDQRTLEEYVGTYQGSSGIGITITRQGDRLFASVNGGSGVEQEAQARDIVFTSGHGATPKAFQRDGSGKITGFVYLRGSHSLTFTRKAA